MGSQPEFTGRSRGSVVVACALLLAACSGGGEYRATADDRDGDGLTNAEEAALGSNPDAADTDRDGWDDRVEVDNYTNPLDGWDHPYTGGWEIDPCRNDLVGQGGGAGSVAPQFSLMDQHGDPVRLHDFCDGPVIIASAAQWCEPCVVEATFLQTMYEKYADDGLMVITLLGEDINNRTPTPEVLNEWVDIADITYPVLQDTSFTTTLLFTGQNRALPANQLLGPGAVIQRSNLMEIHEEDILELLQ